MLILREAFYGTTRFDDFAERVGIYQPVAAARLKELVDDGLLEREPYRDPGQRTRYRYRLTEKGADLFPVLVALKQWGDRWLAPSGAPVELQPPRLRRARVGAAALRRRAAGRRPPSSTWWSDPADAPAPAQRYRHRMTPRTVAVVVAIAALPRVLAWLGASIAARFRRA